MSSPSFFFNNSSGLRLIGKISRDGILYLDFSAHFAQYINGAEGGIAEGGIANIHFANLVSFIHNRFGGG
jgi:hypothetical protein